MYRQYLFEWHCLSLSEKINIIFRFCLALWTVLSVAGVVVVFFYFELFNIPTSVFLPSIFSVGFFAFAPVVVFMVVFAVLFLVVLCACSWLYFYIVARFDFKLIYICLLYGVGFYGLDVFGVAGDLDGSLNYILAVLFSMMFLCWLFGFCFVSILCCFVVFFVSYFSFVVFRLLFSFGDFGSDWLFLGILFGGLFFQHYCLMANGLGKLVVFSCVVLMVFLCILLFAGAFPKFALVSLTNLGVVDPVKSVFLQGKDSSGDLFFGDKFHGPELNGGCPSWKDAVMNSGRAICGYRNYNFGGYSVICNKPSFLVYIETIDSNKLKDFYCISIENKEIPSVIRASQ